MFSDTFRGGVDMASASMRYLYNRASKFGLSSFNEDELTPEEKRKNITKFRSTRVGGLYNEGNTCFMNSVVQSLASLTSINRFVNEVQVHKSTNFSHQLAQLIHDLNRIKTTNHTYSTGKLVQNMGGSSRWNRLDQEDAQEFFQQLLTSLEKDWKQQQPAPASTDTAASASTSADAAADAAPASEKAKPQPIITPFDGHYAMRVGCLTCGDMEGIRTGVISSIDLGLDLDHSEFTLQGLLDEYCHMETINGVECYRCTLNDYKTKIQEKLTEVAAGPLADALNQRISEVDSALKEKVIDDKRYAQLKCTSHRSLGDKTKQTMLSRPLPEVVMVHINRSVFDMRTGFSRKNYAPVEFPAQLDLAPYVADREDPANQNPSYPMKGLQHEHEWYELKATVIHYGSANFGHYVSFRKFNGFWWRISDDSVDLTTEAQVLGAQGVFMLFYEKQGDAQPDQSLRQLESELDAETESSSDIEVVDIGETSEGSTAPEGTEAAPAAPEGAPEMVPDTPEGPDTDALCTDLDESRL